MQGWDFWCIPYRHSDSSCLLLVVLSLTVGPSHYFSSTIIFPTILLSTVPVVIGGNHLVKVTGWQLLMEAIIYELLMLVSTEFYLNCCISYWNCLYRSFPYLYLFALTCSLYTKGERYLTPSVSSAIFEVMNCITNSPPPNFLVHFNVNSYIQISEFIWWDSVLRNYCLLVISLHRHFLSWSQSNLDLSVPKLTLEASDTLPAFLCNNNILQSHPKIFLI